jgi:ATP-binding cassette subfamily C protein
VPTYGRAADTEGLPEVDASKKHPGELWLGRSQGRLFVHRRSEILKNTTFSASREFIALVGPSGSGKSTLFRLMLGFEKPSRGSIYYDNQDLADLDVRAVRRQLGVVLQGGQLMTGDIFTNIVGTSSLTIDDAWQAARMVGLEDDINEMPMGIHTGISGIQHAFRRSATAHPDRTRHRAPTAHSVLRRERSTTARRRSSRSLEQPATRIVIAHRLSTVINADRIIVPGRQHRADRQLQSLSSGRAVCGAGSGRLPDDSPMARGEPERVLGAGPRLLSPMCGALAVNLIRKRFWVACAWQPNISKT